MRILFKNENLSIPFPQANDVYKILKYMDSQIASYHQKTFSYISDDYVDRQKMYYRNAAQYLGFLVDSTPSDWAKKIFLLEPDYLFVSTAQTILSHEIFFRYYKNRSKDEVTEYLKTNYNLSESTSSRRFSTVQRWVEWCDIIIKDNELEVSYGA